jgi:hypothetical protein
VPAIDLSDAGAAVGGRPLRARRWLPAAAAGLLLAAIGVAVAVVDPFAGSAARPRSAATDGAPTALATVVRGSLTSRMPVSGTLGYAGSWTVAAPAGTSTTDLQQARQAATAARAAYTAAQATETADAQTLATAANDAQVAQARQKVDVDQAQLSGDRSVLASAQQALSAAESAALPYASPASYTMLPATGAVVRLGQVLYEVNGSPTLLLYGGRPAWRRFAPGMSSGTDVAELNASLRALGYGAESGAAYTSTTERAIELLQRAHGLAETGTLPLGAVAFEPAAARVTSVTPTPGQVVQPGPVMTLSSTTQAVSIPLDVSQQTGVRVGVKVLVTLPDSSTTPGVVSAVGRVATVPPSGQGDSSGGNGGGGSATPTIEVDVRLLHPAAAGSLDQAPVSVLITTASVRDALAVPVNALVALAGGGYAVEVIAADGTHRLVAVRPGLFDDQAGSVQVTGRGLAAGQRVVVPAS